MAFSLSHQKTLELPLGEFTREQFLVLAIEAAQQEDWSIGQTTAQGFTAFSGFSLSSFCEEISIEIQEETALIKSECLGTQLYDWGKNKRNLQAFRGNFKDVQQYLTPEDLANRYQYWKEEHGFTETSEVEVVNKTAPTFLSVFIPAGGYFITPILLNLNLLVFIIMAMFGVNVLNPSSYSLLVWGANFQPKTLDGEVWRLLSCCFLHIGVLHLIMNMYALTYIGSLLEPLLGRYRFLMAYLATGILASLASVWWYPVTISAGASGAIFGLYGIFLALLISNYFEQSARKAFFMSTSLFVAWSLWNGLSSRGVDNAAHIGGLLSGFMLGYTFLPSLRNLVGKNTFKKPDWLASAAVIILVGSIYLTLPNNVILFDQKLREFKQNEARNQEVYDFDSYVFKSNNIRSIVKKGLKTWNQNLKITEEIAHLDLTEPYFNKNELLKMYCRRRIQTYEMMLKIAEAEDPEQYRRIYQRYNANLRWYILQLE
jgi:rhomboid protease GluP